MRRHRRPPFRHPLGGSSNRRRATVLSGALLALVLLPAAAEETVSPAKGDEAVAEAPVAPAVAAKVVVTARPVVEEVRRDALAGAVTTIGTRQIEDLNASDPAAALRRVPGLVVSRYNVVGSYGGGDGGGVFARGVGSGRPGAELTFSVDGVPKTAGVWTHPLLDALPLDAAESIDVYKGAQPVLFGNAAFATIDFVTKRRTEEGFGGRATAAYGSFATSTLAAEVSGRSGPLDLFVTASRRRSGGHREASDGRTSSLFARAGWDLGGGWGIALTGDLTGGRASDPGVAGGPPRGVTPVWESDDALGVLTLTRRHGAKEGFVKLSLEDGSIDWLQWDGGGKQSFRTFTGWRNAGLRARDAFDLPGGGELTVGLDVESVHGTSREARVAVDVPLGDHRFRNVAPYAALAWTFGGAVKVTPSAGARWNRSREFGGVWGAQAGVSVASSLGEAHVRWARAFSLPGIWAAVFTEGYGRAGEWKLLEPELVDHFEVGFAPRLRAKASLDAALFLDDVSDALRFVPPPPPPPRWANTGAYRARGGELTLRLEPVPAVGLYAGAAYVETTPSNVPYTPRWTFSGGAVATVAALRLAVDAQWVDERLVGNLRFPGAPARVDAYFLLNGKASARLDPLLPGLVVFVAGENLTGSDYAYRPGYPMPGTTVSAGASLGF
jgi:iron complex outermembrane receptor protein